MKLNSPENRALFRNLWALTKPYWTSEDKYKAIGLLVLVVALSLGMVYMNVLFNAWNNDVYNSLQNLDQKAFQDALIRFSWMAGVWIVISVYALWFQQMLEIRWRRWLTAHYVKRWLADDNFYRLQLTDSKTDNPDQRIADDVGQFVESTLSLSLGLLRAVVTLVSFVGILWQLSGPLKFSLSGYAIVIPGYMVWVAILYALVGTVITMRLGKPLVGLNFMQQRFEANFRFGLVRIRENAESVALYQGQAEENLRLRDSFMHVVGNFWSIMRMKKRLSWFTSFWGQLAIIFPFVVAAPRLFAREIKLGGLMQIASAFSQVYGALNFIIDSFTTLAVWKAVIDRLTSFTDGMKTAEALPRLPVAPAATGLAVEELSVLKPDGSVLLDKASFTLKTGDALLIRGQSGTGKTTFLRALSGIWPYAGGKVSRAEGQMLFLSQKPYLPLGTLRAALYYPEPVQEGDVRLPDLLALAGLAHLAGRLDETDNWSHILSLGEQQRVALVRALLMKPAYLFMDESTSALDHAAEARLLAAIREAMSGGIIVSVGHRDGLDAFHTQHLSCLGDGRWHWGRVPNTESV